MCGTKPRVEIGGIVVRACRRWLFVPCLVLSLLGSPPAQAQGRDGDPPAELGAQLLQFFDALSAYVRKDYDRAFPLFLRLARLGMAEAQFYVGVMYDFGYGVAIDDREAARWYRRAAEQGNATAQFNLGVMYANGEGVPQDYAEALRWYRLAAAQGHAEAQFNLGVMYANGEGVPQDYAEALRWYRLAAAEGLAEAQFNLGVMYANGEGLPQDYAEALRWYRLAAAQGYAKAQFNLGVMYDNGEGVPQDYAEAVRWYRRAAEQGHAGAMNNLGVMYEHGLGVRRDPVRAHMWYNLAAAKETDPEKRALSLRNRDDVAARMSPSQLAEAQRLARAWRPGSAGAADPEPAAGPIPGSGLVREVQQLLAKLGFDPGPADGIVGARTRWAVRAYERSRGLPETGVVDARLLALLRAAAAEREARVPPPPAPPGSPVLTDEDVRRLVESGKGQIIQPGQPDPPAASAGEPSAPEPVHLAGSGFWVSEKGHVLTNRHVAENCRNVTVHDSVGAVHEAVLLALGREDLALLATRARPAAVSVFRDGESGLLGEPVVTYGFPLSGLLASAGNLGTGTVAALAGPLDDATLLQITAPVQAGNSGGPVLDPKGRVVGVVVAKLDAVKVARATGDLPQNVNFAIKAPVAVRFLEAQGIEVTVTPFGRDLPRAELADYAKAISVRIDCTR